MSAQCGSDGIPQATLGRVPAYVRYLRAAVKTLPSVSATVVAKALGFGEVQVRKDLRVLCGAGKPKIGYDTSELLSCVERYVDPAGGVF